MLLRHQAHWLSIILLLPTLVVATGDLETDPKINNLEGRKFSVPTRGHTRRGQIGEICVRPSRTYSLQYCFANLQSHFVYCSPDGVWKAKPCPPEKYIQFTRSSDAWLIWLM